MKLRNLLFLFVLLLMACTPVQVIITATPGTLPTGAVSATVEPSATSAQVIVTNTPRPVSSPTTETMQTCSRPFYNVNGQGLADEPYLIAHAREVNPCTVLVMDNFGLAIRFKQEFPNAVVITRTYSAYEGGQCLQDNPRAQVDRFIAEANGFGSQVKNQLVLYGCSNEPSYGSNNSLQQILSAEHEFMTYAKSKGVKVCSGNWGVGNFNPDHVDAGLYNQYLRDIADGGHYLCVHEYTTFFMPFGVGLFSRECLIQGYQLNPPRNACVQPKNWPTRTQIQPRRIPFPSLAQSEETWLDVPFGYQMMLPYYSLPQAQATSGVLPPYWHIFRVYWLFIVADELGIPRPQTIVTECCHDNLSDIDRAEPRALSILEPIFGNPVFMNDLRGAPSHCRLWETYYFPQWSCEEALLQQWLWWDSVADPSIIGFTAYTWSYHPHWISFNMATNQTEMNTENFHHLFEECYGHVPHCDFSP
jgi:hypothetical protein